ncbi:uncharacterized protein LOC123674012 isoform X2 [Harmonia axyridis]|uniref:uncharacterized protein LOC123674012 isoform X2 n=1 Tax=Harmonia axyridis TaxID=115357 RepID=UPI001E276E82|nr:uncharacterized protein LOC123674012 isoform X2 [Harmonia axyridis]
MSSKKKDLEIIFNLQWKNGPKVAERSNMVGVYDIPSTTLNWELFKSYILKNSGTPGDDVEVSYLEHGKEFPIESTLDFHTALYSFRKKAMNGEIINLRLESLSNCYKSNKYSPTCDAQTECSSSYEMERAPGWFVDYMTEFKKEILNEVASAITTHAAVLRTSFSHSHYPRKSKTECAKRSRKNHHHDGNEKEVLKTIKMENKLQSKMEKLVNKSKKLEKKKISLITKSSDSDAGHSSSKSNSETMSTVDVSKMNATPMRSEAIIPHLMGGEEYPHCWKVINNGADAWTEETELHFSWGSSLLEPIQRVLPCPHLKPGDVGIIEALIRVPKICGKYEMYWHFHHKGRKFGHWLGCQIIVDKINSSSFFNSLSSRHITTPSSTSKGQTDLKTSGSSQNIDLSTIQLLDEIFANTRARQSKVPGPKFEITSSSISSSDSKTSGSLENRSDSTLKDQHCETSTILDNINDPSMSSKGHSDAKTSASKYDIPSSSTSKGQSDFKTSGSLENRHILTVKEELNESSQILNKIIDGYYERPKGQSSQSEIKTSGSKYDIPSSSTSNGQSDFKTSGSLENRCNCTVIDQMVNNKGIPNIDDILTEKMKEWQISKKYTVPLTVPLTAFSKDKLKPEIEELIINKSPSKIQIIENYFNENNSSVKSNKVVNSAEFVANNNSSTTKIDAEEDRDSHSESISKIDEDTSSNSTLNDMVLLNFPEEVEEQEVLEGGDYHSESISRIEEDTTSISSSNNLVIVDLPDELEQPETLGYAYVVIDGIKMPVPKKFLREDFLETAEEAPEPKKNDDCYRATMERFLEMKYDATDNCEHNKSIPDNENYDDIPDLVPSHHVDNSTNISSEKKTSPFEQLSNPLHSYSESDVMNNEMKVFEDSDLDEEYQTTQNVEKQKQITSNSSVSINPFHQNRSFLEEKEALNPTANEYRGNVNIYPIIYSNDSHPRVPNYQQTPPELRPKPIEQEYPAENSRITYTSNPEVININAFRNDAVPESRDGKIDPSCSFPHAVLVPQVPTVPISSVVMSMASSALRTVVDKIIPSKNEQEPTAENSIRENNLKILADMGFEQRDLNATLLARYDDDMRRVVAELVQ